MAVKGWFDLDPAEQKTAFLNLHRRDINNKDFTSEQLVNLLARFHLLGDLDIRRHFEQENIILPPSINPETKG